MTLSNISLSFIHLVPIVHRVSWYQGFLPGADVLESSAFTHHLDDDILTMSIAIWTSIHSTAVIYCQSNHARITSILYSICWSHNAVFLLLKQVIVLRCERTYKLVDELSVVLLSNLLSLLKTHFVRQLSRHISRIYGFSFGLGAVASCKKLHLLASDINENGSQKFFRQTGCNRCRLHAAVFRATCCSFSLSVSQCCLLQMNEN